MIGLAAYAGAKIPHAPVVQVTAWNPAETGNLTLSLSNYLATCTAVGVAVSNGANSKSSGLLYAEILCGGTGFAGSSHSPSLGVCRPGTGSPGFTTLVGAGLTSWGILSTGLKRNNGAAAAYGSSFTTGDTVGIAINLTSGKVWFSKNGSWQNSGDPAAGVNEAYSGVTGPLVLEFSSNDDARPSGLIRSISGSCVYAPPSGFSLWG